MRGAIGRLGALLAGIGAGGVARVGVIGRGAWLQVGEKGWEEGHCLVCERAGARCVLILVDLFTAGGGLIAT